MSEHNDPAPCPEESPGNEDERTKAARYYDEAATLYRAHLQSVEHQAEPLEPLTKSWLDFETSYEGSFESRIDFVDHVMDDLGWFRILHQIATQMGIPAGALRLDYADVYAYFSRYFRIFDTPEGVLHVFTRDGIKPMAADIASREGRS